MEFTRNWYPEDHLHMCGEYLKFSSIFIANGRITSTCVENTGIASGGKINLGDHLHMCGEYEELQMNFRFE